MEVGVHHCLEEVEAAEEGQATMKMEAAEAVVAAAAIQMHQVREVEAEEAGRPRQV